MRPASPRASATSRPSRVAQADAAGVADVIGAGSLVVSQAALEILEARTTDSKKAKAKTTAAAKEDDS